MVDPEEDATIGSKIAAFVVTLVAIPFLFAATCVPVGFIAMATRAPAVFIVYGVALVACGIWRAVVTRNAGIRWAIIVALIAGFAIFLHFFYPNFNFAIWR